MTQNIEISVNLSPELRLEQALKQAGIEEPATVSKLTVSGMLKNDDFKYMKKNMSETLRELDMGDASFYRNKIPQNTFAKLYGLTAITLPDSINSYYYSAFFNTYIASITVRPNNHFFASEDGILFNKSKTELVLCPSGRKGDYIIPNSVLKIGTGAFWGCADLTSVTIPNSVTEIEFHAFEHCSGLTSITIPDTVMEISIGAFTGCSGLTNITIPDSVTEIRGHAFGHCKGLATITIPNSVKKIEFFAFFGCTALASVFIPASLVEIGKQAFDKCPAFFAVHPDNPAYKSENGKLIKKNETHK